MPVVLDSNLWISALQFGGPPLKALRQALQHGKIGICPAIEREVVNTLSQKFGRSPQVIANLLQDYSAGLLRVVTTGSVQGVCRDPKDDMVLECAVLARANLLVTGDRDLLSLATFGSTRILTARAYLDEATPGSVGVDIASL